MRLQKDPVRKLLELSPGPSSTAVRAWLAYATLLPCAGRHDRRHHPQRWACNYLSDYVSMNGYSIGALSNLPIKRAWGLRVQYDILVSMMRKRQRINEGYASVTWLRCDHHLNKLMHSYDSGSGCLIFFRSPTMSCRSVSEPPPLPIPTSFCFS